MASFYHLFNRFLAEKAKGEKLYVLPLTQRLGEDPASGAEPSDALQLPP